jgi:hypothetical protein
MTGWINRRVTTMVGAVVTALIIGLNAHLLLGLLLGPLVFPRRDQGRDDHPRVSPPRVRQARRGMAR